MRCVSRLKSSGWPGKDQEYNWCSQQDTWQWGEPEALLDGGSQWPPHSMWYRVAVIFLMWAAVGDWEVVEGSPDSIEKVFEAWVPVCQARRHRLHWHVGWIFLTALEVNMDGALCNATPVHNVQRHLEEPEQCTLALEQGPRGFKNPASLTERRWVTVMRNIMRLQVPAWQWGLLYSRKRSMSSLWPRGLPVWLSSRHIDHTLRWGWLTPVSSFGKSKGNLDSLAFATGTVVGLRPAGVCRSLSREVEEGMWDTVLKVWIPQRGPTLAGANLDANVGWFVQRYTIKAVSYDVGLDSVL